MKKTEVVVLETYKPEWNENFIAERSELLKNINGKDVWIEHIGSTSVEGMEARPIIDIMIGLADFNKSIKKVRSVLKDNGYREIENYLELSERCFFVKDDEENIYIEGFSVLVIKLNGGLWRKKIERKRLLLSSEEDRKNYTEFKRKSIEESKGEPTSYFELKEGYFKK